MCCLDLRDSEAQPFAVVSTFSDSTCAQLMGSLSLNANSDCVFLSQIKSQQVFASLSINATGNGTNVLTYSNFVTELDATSSTACADTLSAANCSLGGLNVCAPCFGLFVRVSAVFAAQVGWALVIAWLVLV